MRNRGCVQREEVSSRPFLSLERETGFLTDACSIDQSARHTAPSFGRRLLLIWRMSIERCASARRFLGLCCPLANTPRLNCSSSVPRPSPHPHPRLIVGATAELRADGPSMRSSSPPPSVGRIRRRPLSSGGGRKALLWESRGSVERGGLDRKVNSKGAEAEGGGGVGSAMADGRSLL